MGVMDVHSELHTSHASLIYHAQHAGVHVFTFQWFAQIRETWRAKTVQGKIIPPKRRFGKEEQTRQSGFRMKHFSRA
jgi:hypothetical protein